LAQIEDLSMKVGTPIVRDNSLVYSRLLQDLRQHAEIRRMFIWRNGMQQLHFCSQWDEELGVVPDRLGRIRQVAMKKRMVVTSIEQTGIQHSSTDQQAVAIYRGFADASVLELHLLVSEDPAEMKAQVTKIEQTMQPVADHPNLHELTPIDYLPNPAEPNGTAPTQPSVQLTTGSNGVSLGSLVQNDPKGQHDVDASSGDQLTGQQQARLTHQEFESQHGLVDFFTNINASLDRNETAFNVVSELRRETDADRVSLVSFAQQSRGKLIATSGVAKVNRKGRETIQLEQLVNQICRQNQPFSYPSKEFADIPSRFRSRIESYLTNSSARSMMVIPVTLERTDAPTDVEHSVSQKKKQAQRQRRTIAAIVIENFQTSEFKPELKRYHETLALRAGDAYRNAFLHQRAFLFPLWEFLGRQYDYFIGRHFSKTMTALGLAALAFACMFVLQGQYRLSCDGRLMPEQQRTIWAEVDGIVNEIHVETAEEVSPGDLLVTLENKDLKIQQQEYSGNLFSLRQRLESVDRLLAAETDDVSDTESNARQMSVERASLVQQVKTTEQQLKILEQQMAAQNVTSPIAGVILTADLRKELEDRPISQGTALLDVAAIDGDWVLELKMPDRKVGELLKTQQETEEPLKVSFVRSSEPSIVYEGQVKTIDLSAKIDDEVGQFLRVVVDIDASQIPNRNVGMETVAYLHCGQKSYAYIWTREIVDFVHKHIVFPLF
jgi:biotin carboxyl carrier protein